MQTKSAKIFSLKRNISRFILKLIFKFISRIIILNYIIGNVDSINPF